MLNVSVWECIYVCIYIIYIIFEKTLMLIRKDPDAGKD